jgi:hypothetical protein
MATPSTQKRYVSAITSLDQREINRSIIDIQNNYGLVDVMNAFGRYKPSKMAKVESFVNDPLWKKGEVTGTVTGDGTPTVVVTLTAATSGGRRLNDIVVFPDGKQGFISALTPGTTDAITVKSVDGTNLTVATGNALNFSSNVMGEQSIGRDSVPFAICHRCRGHIKRLWRWKIEKPKSDPKYAWRSLLLSVLKISPHILLSSTRRFRELPLCSTIECRK